MPRPARRVRRTASALHAPQTRDQRRFEGRRKSRERSVRAPSAYRHLLQSSAHCLPQSPKTLVVGEKEPATFSVEADNQQRLIVFRLPAIGKNVELADDAVDDGEIGRAPCGERGE